MFNSGRVPPPAPGALVLGRILGAVLAGTGTLANIAIKDLWQRSTASIPVTILLGGLLYGAIVFAQLQGVSMVVARTPADLSLTPRLRVFGIGLVAMFVLADLFIVAAAVLGLI